MKLTVFVPYLLFFGLLPKSFASDEPVTPYTPRQEFRIAKHCYQELLRYKDIDPNFQKRLERAVYAGDESALGYWPSRIENLRADIRACQNWVKAYINPTSQKQITLSDGSQVSAQTARHSDLVQKAWPIYSGLAAIRIPHIQNQMMSAHASLIDSEYSNTLSTDLPASPMQTPRNHGYPQTPLSEFKSGCSAGGFIDSLNRPNPPHGLFKEKEIKAIREPFYDRDCRTPSQVRLRYNGEEFSINCSGSEKLQAEYPGFSELLMCDPMLYGFYPLKPEKGKKRGAAECAYPGMISGDTSNILPWQTNHICNVLSQKISQKIQEIPEYKKASREEDLSLTMAARLALENPYLWQQKAKRIRDYCGNKKSLFNREVTSCQFLIKRLNLIESTLSSFSQTQQELKPASPSKH